MKKITDRKFKKALREVTNIATLKMDAMKILVGLITGGVYEINKMDSVKEILLDLPIDKAIKEKYIQNSIQTYKDLVTSLDTEIDKISKMTVQEMVNYIDDQKRTKYYE